MCLRSKFHLARLDTFDFVERVKSTRLDTFDFVEPYFSNMADDEEAVVLASSCVYKFSVLCFQRTCK